MALPSWSHTLKIGDIVIQKDSGEKYEISNILQSGSYYTPDSLPYSLPHYVFTIRITNSETNVLSFSDDLIEEQFNPENSK